MSALLIIAVSNHKVLLQKALVIVVQMEEAT